MINKRDSLKRSKLSLESLLADKKILSGKEVIQQQKAKAGQLAEFTKAVEFESRNKRTKK